VDGFECVAIKQLQYLVALNKWLSLGLFVQKFNTLNHHMKILKLILALLICLNAKSQSLANTEWIKIKSARNGSRIICHTPSDQLTVKYYFLEDSVLIALGGAQYSFKLGYSLNNDVLSIGSLLKYKIDSMDNDVIAITDISKKMPEGKLNKFTLINCASVFEYLNATNSINIVGDSLIECDTQFSPTYVGPIENEFSRNSTYSDGNRTLHGELVMSNQGNVKRVNLYPNDKFSKVETDKIIKIFSSTSGSWSVPLAPKNLDYKINFSLNYYSFGPSAGVNAAAVNFSIGEKVTILRNQKMLTKKELKDVNDYFDRGVELIRDDKFEKGIKMFTNCISIDPSYVDAYYNLVYSYKKIGDSNMACETLNKLKTLGEKLADYLFKMNCK
jgi:tetratricopeptide (TPR) repeat protein